MYQGKRFWITFVLCILFLGSSFGIHDENQYQEIYFLAWGVSVAGLILVFATEKQKQWAPIILLGLLTAAFIIVAIVEYFL